MSASTIWKSVIFSAALLVGVGHVWAAPAEEGESRPKKEQREKPAGDKAKAESGDREARQAKRRAQMRERHFEQMFKDVSLTEQQKSRINAIFEENEKRQQAWRDQHKEELAQIREEISKARRADDKEAAKAAHEKLATLMKDAPKQEDVPAAVRELLGADQVEKVEANLKQMRERRQQRGGDRAAGGEGERPRRQADGERRRPRGERQERGERGGDNGGEEAAGGDDAGE